MFVLGEKREETCFLFSFNQQMLAFEFTTHNVATLRTKADVICHVTTLLEEYFKGADFIDSPVYQFDNI